MKTIASNHLATIETHDLGNVTGGVRITLKGRLTALFYAATHPQTRGPMHAPKK